MDTPYCGCELTRVGRSAGAEDARRMEEDEQLQEDIQAAIAASLIQGKAAAAAAIRRSELADGE